jgi:hypothetical protein
MLPGFCSIPHANSRYDLSDCADINYNDNNKAAQIVIATAHKKFLLASTCDMFCHRQGDKMCVVAGATGQDALPMYAYPWLKSANLTNAQNKKEPR